MLAAARLFAGKGYSGASISDIAREVEMTQGTLYHHFAGKEAIFYAVVERIRKTWISVVAREVVSTRNAVERLEILLDRQAMFPCERNYERRALRVHDGRLCLGNVLPAAVRSVRR